MYCSCSYVRYNTCFRHTLLIYLDSLNYFLTQNITLFLLFLFGLFIGSFLNVLIDRLPQGKSILGRSYCDNCKKTLVWKDLIPLISFAYLRGKCRYCRTSLSFQYPFLEIFTGVMFALTYLLIFNFQFSIFNQITNPYSLILSLFFSLTIASVLIVVFFADVKYMIIPDEMVVVGSVVAFVWLMLFNQPAIVEHLLTSVGAFLFFLMIYLLTKGRGMGFGDVKLAFFIGLLLGFIGTILAIYVAFLTGAFIGIILILWKKKRMKSAVPFGPFLIFGTFVSYFFASQILPEIAALLS